MAHLPGGVPDAVFPAGAGMYRTKRSTGPPNSNVPRECGISHWTAGAGLCRPCVPRRRLDDPDAALKYGARLECSPLARGPSNVRQAEGSGDTVFPALAGNTAASAETRPARPDHPHALGKHGGYSAKVVGAHGSSPRRRGTILEVLAVADIHGIIPAPAGMNRPFRLLRRSLLCAPRVRGDEPLLGMLPPRPFRCSPRAWG